MFWMGSMHLNFCCFERGEAIKLDILSCHAGLLGTAISTGTSTLTASRGNTFKIISSKMDIGAVQNFGLNINLLKHLCFHGPLEIIRSIVITDHYYTFKGSFQRFNITKRRHRGVLKATLLKVILTNISSFLILILICAQIQLQCAGGLGMEFPPRLLSRTQQENFAKSIFYTFLLNFLARWAQLCQPLKHKCY